MPARVVLFSVLALAAAAYGQTRDLSADAYLDKLRGMWIGEILGQRAGAPTEGTVVRSGTSHAMNWDTLLATSPWPGDDDTCFEYLYADLLSTRARPTNADLLQTWTAHIPSTSFYIANRQARWLMDYGKAPPDTGSSTWNIHWYAIDSQITTESIGSAFPGLRQNAADMTAQFASVSNQGYAVHAAQFYAAMYSAAAFETDVPALIAKGLAVVPATSRTYQVIQDALAWSNTDLAGPSPDWRTTQAKLYDKYYLGDFGRYRNWIESTINTGLTTMSLLYGQGDFQTTVQIGAQAAFDSDCNAATAGGLIGMARGYGSLVASFTVQPGEAYHVGTLQNIAADTTVTDIARLWQSAAELQIPLMGGSITGTGSNRVYHLPAADVIRAPQEKPDPTGPKGLVGAVLKAGGTVAVSASVDTRLSTDRGNLPGIIDGITDVTYNGRLPYVTDDWVAAQPTGGDFYQLSFDRTLTFASVIFYEGDILPNSTNADPRVLTPRGGYFTDLTVEVRRSGTFVAVSNLHFSEPLDPYKYFQTIELSFDPADGEAIRIRGTAGGTYQFTSIVELEAYGPALTGDANRDGMVDQADYTVWYNHYGLSGALWSEGDYNRDGQVDQADYTLWYNNYGAGGSSLPEPSCLAMLGAGVAALLRRR